MLLALCATFFLAYAHAGLVGLGGRCTSANNRLDPESHVYSSQCIDKAFCSAGVNGIGICVARRCSRDEYPFGYKEGETVPPTCPRGMYCPDEGDSCHPVLPVGQPCQYNRDEQCAPPPSNFKSFSLCLNKICIYATADLNQSCVIDRMSYTFADASDQTQTVQITRDNCRAPEYFCNTDTNVCDRSKGLYTSCRADQECQSRACGSNDVCIDTPGAPISIPAWKYAITVLFVVAGMTVVCVMLTFVHRRHREENLAEIEEYYHEQMRLRSSIISLHESASAHYETTH